MNLTDLVSIGITTKNRWADLKITLEKIRAAKWGDLPLFIIDDNSDSPCPFDVKEWFPQVKLTRLTDSQGYIVRRNQLAREMETKYYLSLDDDSYPVSGDLEAAVAFAQSHSNLLCVAFPIYNPILGVYQNPSASETPSQVRFFVGCGHLLHIDNFLRLGGYKEELIHQGEEMEIAARAFQSGLYCYHFPGLEIHHTASNEGRNWYRMDFYGSRNLVLWNDWYVPDELNWIKQGRTLVSRVIQLFKVGRFGTIQGELAGFRDIPKYKGNRKRMSRELFKQWESISYRTHLRSF